MWWLIKWILLMPLSSVLAGKSGTPPPYVPPDKGPPKDFNNCRLNGMSPVSWIVSVWDTAENVIVGHGSLFTYIAFVSTCRQYSKSPSSYIAHGQNIWDVKEPTNPCMQQKEVETIIKHPNCSKEIFHFPFSDFSVFKLKKPFEIAGHHYPMMALPDSQEDHMDDITYINTINDPKGCFLASFMDQEKKMPIFNLEVNMKIIPFQKNCVKLMCEWNPSDKEKCEKQFKQTGHENDTSTMICAKNSTEAKIVLGKSNSYWLAGAPFLCNGSTYGIASVPVMRDQFPADKTDFHYIVNFFHALPWLVQYLKTYANPWVEVKYLGNRSLKNEGDPPDPPYVPHIDSSTEPFPPIPTLKPGGAAHNTPSVAQSLLCLFTVTTLSWGGR